MMPRLTFWLFLVATCAFTKSVPAQEPSPQPKPQTARQALAEIATKGGESLQKHLTVEVQELLKSNKSVPSALAMMSSFKQEDGLLAFETGDVLFAYEEPTQHDRYEVRVDSDDLAGDEDSLQLSIHLIHDGKEQSVGFGLMSAHFTVSMKLQQNIWRLDKIAVGTEIPIGDPEFFTKTLNSEGAVAGNTSVSFAGLHAVHEGADAAPSQAPPQQAVRNLASAEILFAQMHPQIGFSCSLSELSEASKLMQVDPQVNNGLYKGYRFSLTGCQGRPAGSFQIFAEPAVATPNAKAYCVDATQNLRASDDGRGATCLSVGNPISPAASQGESRFYTAADDSKK
jgi:hypothetical protein